MYILLIVIQNYEKLKLHQHLLDRDQPLGTRDQADSACSRSTPSKFSKKDKKMCLNPTLPCPLFPIPSLLDYFIADAVRSSYYKYLALLFWMKFSGLC